ncbi:hypothetical protein NIES2104_57600 [Leptolyngbya sp. NIES-2104]|nr:hypothetical protein NIES2104_57600 [Leptolyngbya sp. NIES-2104]
MTILYRLPGLESMSHKILDRTQFSKICCTNFQERCYSEKAQNVRA